MVEQNTFQLNIVKEITFSDNSHKMFGINQSKDLNHVQILSFQDYQLDTPSHSTINQDKN